MTTTVSPAESDIFAALRTFILSLIPCEVVQGLANGAPMPLGGFIAMTALFQNRLSTNTDSYSDPYPVAGTRTVEQATQYTVQVDCYGPSSSDWATILTTMLRDDYGCVSMAPNVFPLYADDPKQMPLIDGEQQYEQRWVITAVLQYNPVVTISQDFAAALSVGLVNVDATYPPA